jgi:SAM-dependent methyltransferase
VTPRSPEPPAAAAPDAAPAAFDAFARDYDAALRQGLAVSGEGKDFFARGRLAWTARLLASLDPGGSPARVMDFGCGTGSATPYVFEQLPGVAHLLGTDVSAASLAVARREHPESRAAFRLMGEYAPDGSFDLVFCNGVFHHIRPVERDAAVRYVHGSLRPGGWFALWENNPWNAGTRYVMSRIPFDRDAILLSPLESQGMLRRAGFRVLRTDFLFIFPRSLGFLRRAEPALSRLPLGAQYLVLGRKRA